MRVVQRKETVHEYLMSKHYTVTLIKVLTCMYEALLRLLMCYSFEFSDVKQEELHCISRLFGHQLFGHPFHRLHLCHCQKYTML